MIKVLIFCDTADDLFLFQANVRDEVVAVRGNVLHQSINQSLFVKRLITSTDISKSFHRKRNQQNPPKQAYESIRDGGGEKLPRGKKLRADPGSELYSSCLP